MPLKCLWELTLHWWVRVIHPLLLFLCFPPGFSDIPVCLSTSMQVSVVLKTCEVRPSEYRSTQ